MKNRTLYFGDNLEILQKKIPDESFDLIYLDPPFNSNRNYNVLFKEGLQDSPSQVQAFEDSWHWNRDSKIIFDYLVTKTNGDISNLMLALEKMVGHNDLLAYLSMMAVRLIELHRVLKKTGSLYLHCDPTASHYLKIVLDVIFGKNNFRNEIVWKKTNSPKSQTKAFGSQHDIIFFYSKSDNFKCDKVFAPIDDEYAAAFRYDDDDGKGPYQTVALVAGGMQKYEGRKEFEFQGVKAQWLYTKENLDEMYEQNLLYKTSGGMFRKKVYLKDIEGKGVSDIWADEGVSPLQGASKESLGYATQKPVALLERIIQASSKENDWVLDPFCGCGTTVAAAEKLKRNWVGIDITTLAISLIKRRLKDHFDLGSKQIYVDGLPSDLSGARELFKKNPFEFEYWVLDMINATPAQSKSKENMRGADKGIDGIITFIKDYYSNGNGKKKNGNGDYRYGKAIVQVKGGSVQRNQIATLKGDVEREKAEAGIFITLEEPTKPMIQEAIDVDSFTTLITGKLEFPKIQILTIAELLKGKLPYLPQGLVKDYNKKAQPIEVKNKEFWHNNMAVLF
ncbi:site-specific DNA-methyltransferase [Candidatus Kuenenbacteria bacterium CG10_big_fil_rev_8_21_14_0_10_36_11]|uniref:Site-specific DNA-methyltransferase n=1 Tax=Candidatus Kuenenbacteria bacterium CG10_big_fil_rev_8_21_14_0_10_36_11 TaxID=1974618 RepID=A0A2M6WAK3_9BACT|nr:MAG: site-specific DNA-methyltransferase [Candidatus Kuenenbacteria bacterium CG10_big_fil_rev_8_21_14_0_10_36_11]